VLPDRQWPSRTIAKAPTWCSVDLRDGNQALIEPMDADRKLRMFRLLVKMGYKEIEIGFPAASQTDYDFTRKLIERGLIPDDVTVQVLTQVARAQIARTFEALEASGARSSTCTTRRRPRSGVSCSVSTRDGIKGIAVSGAKLIATTSRAVRHRVVPRILAGELHRDRARLRGGNLRRGDGRLAADPTAEDHPQSAIDGRARHAQHLCRPDRVDVPASRAPRRVIVSVHPHNDRGCGIASAELALMAGRGARRGMPVRQRRAHGQRLPRHARLNLFTQGIDPGIDFSDIQQVIRDGRILQPAALDPRHPYGGELVFTRFLRLAPGRDQERSRRTRARAGARQRRVGRAVSSDRSRRHRSHL
jgi:2-isopropylmalate synthase